MFVAVAYPGQTAAEKIKAEKYLDPFKWSQMLGRFGILGGGGAVDVASLSFESTGGWQWTCFLSFVLLSLSPTIIDGRIELSKELQTASNSFKQLQTASARSIHIIYPISPPLPSTF